MDLTAIGAIIALILAIILILKRIEPTYAMIFAAVIGGLIGGEGLVETVNIMMSGVESVVPAIVRIVSAGVLAGVLIETGAANRIADSIIKRIGDDKALIAIMLASWLLTSVGVFADVAVITTAPIAIQIARQTNYKKLGVMMALIGGAKAGNIMSPNPNAIAAAEAFNLPLTTVMIIGIPSAIAALIFTTIMSKRLAHEGSTFEESAESDLSKDDLPSLFSSLIGPLVAISLLLLRPIADINVDPLIALPVGGLVGVLAMRKQENLISYLGSGLEKMSGVAMLLIGTGTLAGIIANSALKEVIISGIEYIGLQPYLLAPVSGAFMGAAAASSTAGTVLATNVFGSAILDGGVSVIAAAAMTHVGTFIFDGLPHGSFFHVSAGAINMEIPERLKILKYEVLNGFIMTVVSVIIFGILKLAG